MVIARTNTAAAESSGRRVPLFHVLVGGLLLGLAYPPVGLWFLAWPALAPLFADVRSSGPRNAFLRAWAFYLIVFGSAFFWPLTHLRPDTAVVSASAWLALTVLLSVPFALSAMPELKLTPRARTWLAGALLIGLELLLERGPIPMPWSSLAYTQSDWPAAVRSASVLGSEGTTLAVVMAGILVGDIAYVRHATRSRMRIGWTLCLIPPVLILVLGWPREPVKNGQMLQLAVVQPALSAREWSDVHDATRIDTLIEQSDRLLERLESDSLSPSRSLPELFLWPETALPVSETDRLEIAYAEVLAFSARSGVSVLTGAITSTPENNARSYRNSILLFKPDGSISRAAKNILVPFAEYVPLSGPLPWLSRLAVPAGGVDGYIPGRAPSVFEFSGGLIGVLVCFESAFPGYAARLESLGSRLLVVLTQDGWWRGTAAATQHYSMARFRAAETGRFVVQVGVTGITGLIDASGRTVSKLPSDVAGTAVFSVPMLDGSTTYRRFGGWMVPAALGIWIALLGLYGLRLRQNFAP